MCFHSKQTKKAVVLENRYKAKVENSTLFETSANYNGFDFPKTPVITHENKEVIQLLQWGLIPKEEESDEIKKFTLNAKIETLTEKRSFKNVISNRCLIIVDGFYEWQWLDNAGRKKQKYELTLPDEVPFAFGGLWSMWEDPTSGEALSTYTIVTTEANEQMAEIHNSKKRMPVILTENTENGWLNNEPTKDFVNVNPELMAKKIVKYNPQTSLFG